MENENIRENIKEEERQVQQINYHEYLHKYVKVKTIAGHEFDAYMDGLDSDNIYLLIPFQMREEETKEESRAYGYPGFGYGYPGYGFGYPGYGYAYPGYGYQFGRLILPIAALTTIAII